MTDEAALVAAVCAAGPGERTPRLVYADYLDDHGGGERAALVRAVLAAEDLDTYQGRAAVLADPLAAFAAVAEAEGRSGLAEYARRGLWVETYVGPREPVWQREVNRLYDTLLDRWRVWLPGEVTTLTRRADREVYNKDYGAPAVTFPSRRKSSWKYDNPKMSVCFTYGVPVWVECDDEDWARAGPAIVRWYPWVVRERDIYSGW